jgi:hypothetical protein
LFVLSFEGRFTAHLVSSRFQVILRNNLAIDTPFQYNNETRQLSSYVWFYWIFGPGSDFFIVYNETDQRGGSFGGAEHRSLTAKLNYLFSLLNPIAET